MKKNEKKKLLELFPIPEITKDLRKIIRKEYEGCCDYFAPQFKDGILCIDLFCFKKNVAIHKTRFFLKEKEWINFYPLKDTWGTASLLYNREWCSNYIKEEDKKIISDALVLFGAKTEPSFTIYFIDSYISSIKFDKKKAKVKLETDAISERFKGLKQPSNSFFDFLSKEAARDINFAYFNKKEKTVSCPVCGKEYNISEFGNVKNNEFGTCPECRAHVKFISVKSMKSKTFYRMGVIFQKYPQDPKVIISRTFEISKTYTRKNKYPKVRVREVFRTLLGKKYLKGFEDYEYADTHKVGESEWNYAKPYRNMFYYRPTYNYSYPAMLYKKGLSNVFKGTDFEQYSPRVFCFEEFQDTASYDLIEGAMSRFIQFPVIESLIKMNKIGCDDIVRSLIRDDHIISYISENKSTSSCEFLEITPAQLKVLSEMPEAHKYAEDGHKYAEAGLEMKYYTAENISFLHNFGNFKNIKGLNIDKLRKYIQKNNIRAIDYIDYLDMVQKITYSTLRQMPLYPEPFKEAHDEAAKLTQFIVSPREDGIFAELSKEWEKLEFEDDNYAIIRPQKEEELIAEGLALNHCVHNYIPKIINQEKIIMFIRQTKNKNKPFATMEIANNEIVQARKNSNVDATEIMDFLNAYCEKMQLKFSSMFNYDYNNRAMAQ